MKRLTMDALEALAFQNPGSEIEQSTEDNVAVLTVGRETYYAVAVTADA